MILISFQCMALDFHRVRPAERSEAVMQLATKKQSERSDDCFFGADGALDFQAERPSEARLSSLPINGVRLPIYGVRLP